MNNGQAAAILQEVQNETSPYFAGNHCRATLKIGNLSTLVCQSATEAKMVWRRMVRNDESLDRLTVTCTFIETGDIVWTHRSH